MTTVREQFLSQRLDPTVSGQAIARTLVSSDLCGAKLDLAMRITMGRHYRDDDLRGDVAVVVCASIATYVMKTRGKDYTDGGEDSFAGWVYSLARRHVEWALSKAFTKQRRLRAIVRQSMASPQPASAVYVSERQYERAQEKVMQAIEELPAKERQVALLHLAGASLQQTATQVGLALDSVKVMRSRVLMKLRPVVEACYS